jgi:hypothetical protein
MGHEVEFLDYRPDYAGWQPLRNLGIRSCTFVSAVPRGLRFARFRQRYLPSTPVLRTAAAVRRVVTRYDAVIVGSDQVWNGNLFGRFDPVYFLDFVPEQGCRRISYAACFGQPVQPPETMTGAGPLLRRFHHLSVRGAISRDMVRTLADREASIIGDPTILHDFTEFTQGCAAGEKYVLVYNLAPDKRAPGERIVRQVKERMGLPVVAAWPTEGFAGTDRTVRVLGPVEWLRLLRNATAVCTDSFHGAVFAVKFQKPLFAWAGGSPDRLRDFLAQCGMSDRWMAGSDGAATARLAEQPTDWPRAAKGIATLRSRATAFLVHALQ